MNSPNELAIWFTIALVVYATISLFPVINSKLRFTKSH